MGENVVIDMESGEVVEKELPESEFQDEDPQGNQPQNNGHEEEDDDEDDQPPQSGEGEDPEREEIRNRRRQERRDRKQAARERETSLRRELAARDSIINELRTRVEAIDRRNTGSEVAQLEAEMGKLGQAHQYYKEQIRLGTEAKNGAAVAEATDKLLKIQRRAEELSRISSAYRNQSNAPQPLDPRLVNQAQKWMERNRWYNPQGGDVESQIVMTLDRQLSSEGGWDPTTPQYWEELDSRIKKYLPRRDKMGSARPRSVVPGSGRESSGSSGKSTFVLSADRVKALKDAGLWDDPKQRTEAIKRFQQYDKENRG